MTREFRVGVFEHQKRGGIGLTAYMLWYDPRWTGCCEHVVTAASGTAAKRAAMDEHRDQCMARGDSGGGSDAD